MGETHVLLLANPTLNPIPHGVSPEDHVAALGHRGLDAQLSSRMNESLHDTRYERNAFLQPILAGI